MKSVEERLGEMLVKLVHQAGVSQTRAADLVYVDLSAPEKQLNLEFNVTEAGVDSLQMVEFLALLETEFDVALPPDQVTGELTGTVEELLELVQ